MSVRTQRRVSNTGIGTSYSLTASSASRTVPGSSRPVTAESGLSSLSSTLSKLKDDEDRHQSLMDDVSRRLRLPGRIQDHKNQSFVSSDYVFVKTIGQGHFGLVKMAKRKVQQAVLDAKNQMGVPPTPRKSLPKGERSMKAAAEFMAVRIIPRTRVRNQRLSTKELFTKLETYPTLKRQVDAMRDLDHPNIVRVYETFEDFQNIYIVMQLCTGGSILEAREVREGKTMSEKRAAQLLEQIFAAMAYCHDRGVVHQDIRLENIHYASEAEDARIIITDWGAVEYISTPPALSRKYLAITDYNAPELVPQWRTDRSDVWSIGICMHALLTQSLPEWPEWPPVADFSWAQEFEMSFSLPCRHLLVTLLRLDPAKRPSARECLTDSWVIGGRTDATSDALNVLPVTMGSSLMKFRRANRMQKAMAWFAATHLSGEQMHELQRAFNAIDVDRSGTIDKREMEEALKTCLWQARREHEKTSHESAQELVEDLDEVLSDEKNLAGMVAAMDVDGSGVISFSNFLSAAMDQHLQDSVQLLWQAFKRFDHQGTGRISHMELASLLKTAEVDSVLQRLPGTHRNKPIGADGLPTFKRSKTVNELMEVFSAMGATPKTPQELLQQADLNNDGCISFDEFIAVVTDEKEDAGS